MKYISGPYNQAQLKTAIDAAEISLTNRFLRGGVITDATEQRTWTQKIEAASFGRNTVLFDDQGNPSVMVAMPMFKEVDVLSGARNYPHPAFLVNGVTKPMVYLSKYQNIVVGAGVASRALSLKGVDPTVYPTFDQSLTHCKQKGAGWHLMTNAEWAAVALLCKSRGFMPRGNNNYGADYSVATEKGVPCYWYDSSGTKYIGRVLTGSGPLGWTSDGSPFGLYDLNGNIYEWSAGTRTNNGEIQVLQDNNAADNTQDQTVASAAWRSMLQSGTLCYSKWVTSKAYALNEVIAPANGSTYVCTTAGTSGAAEPTWPGTGTVTDGGAVWTYQSDLTLKYDFVNAPVNGGAGRINTATQPNASSYYSYNTFETEAIAAGVTVPNLLKLLGLAPIDSSHGADGLYVNTNGERLAIRGGGWSDTSGAGVFFLYLSSARSAASDNIGFRSAFVL